ncbi:MAG: quinolinate synthase [Candidatus Aquicultor secundus]|uniref:Quinolinate synthase n=1 Tax=Candidatus Aquicultor secundus TaxID=1973895 RepID=A0A2M7T8B6_9ACTN|nr:quinolinate synthase NadA [Solirubrobacter sp.]PIU27156.1 MAG: quinolinate synthase [Candidatus Aquicultor secundus]PIW22780.1 MAG: quinolinate synthase [Candidatus Aquicultor secundus]PIX51933.1 MAG: quinolinate synthase [Candidatus Aquicultor secundus]PIY38156.1 MAG: quinolinate synthase [Candidatus Aquicultor secundus]
MSCDTNMVNEIQRLKKERNAIILAHNYQVAEVQDIADFVGDSLRLSQQAAATSADVIVFCGVHFMAETAAILSPTKTVLLPDINAGCPMADMVTADELREFKAQHPGTPVVTYINSSAEVKAESDYCCTSANAVKIIEAIDADEIIFVPDQHLGHYAATKTSKNIILWKGYCPTHRRITPEELTKQKEAHPNAKAVVHPESLAEVIALADAVASTEGILRYARETDAKEFIIGTEVGILHRLRKENPDKVFYPAFERAICPNMKRTTLEKVLFSLQDMEHVITVPEDIAALAKRAIDRMLQIV